MKEKFYISTAIAYASAKPHIGNTYEIILADAIARYKRLTGYEVYFQTGTDEHGEKIALKAQEANLNPQEFVDEVSLEIRRIWDVVNASYDNFIRTSNPHHRQVVSKIFEKLYKQGDIYKGEYEGWYCTPCESFFTETQLIDEKCPDCGGIVHKEKEDAYFLKLSKYEERLKDYINNNVSFLQPEVRKNEMMSNFINQGLQDLCVSRTSFEWGVPVTFDQGHVIYVWVDALSNYITFLGYDVDGNHDEDFKEFWPADIHLVGKDIFRFHAIYWPIILMALDLPLPKKIFAHPWVLMGNEKMSKSRGNLIYADDLVKTFGVDEIRYFLLNEIPYINDGILTYDLIIERINSDLANNLGNLVNRTISMSKKYFDGVVMEPKVIEKIDQELIDTVLNSKNKIENYMNELKVSSALEEIFNIFKRANKYIDETAPWILAKDDSKKERLATVLYNLLESIRQGAVLLQPFMPDTSDKVLKQLNTGNKDYNSLKTFDGLDYEIVLNDPEVLFARIDATEKLEQINKELI